MFNKAVKCSFLILSLSLILLGCKQELTNNAYNIKIATESSILVTSKVFNKAEAFTFDDINLGRINKILEHKNLLYIHTSSGELRIHVFDKDKGRTINSIAFIGNGPNEFLSVRNIFIFENYFYAFDYMRKNLHQFNLEGKNQKIIKLPDYAEDVNFIDSTTIVLYKKGRSGPDSKGEFKINIFTIKNNNLVYKNQFSNLVPVEEERNFSQLNTLFRFNNKLLLTEPFSNEFIEINGEEIKSFFNINFNQHQIPHNEYYNTSLNQSDFIRFCKTSDNIWNLNNVMSNGNYIFFSFYHKEQLFSNLHNFAKNQTITYGTFYDDLLLQLSIPTNSFKLDLKPVNLSDDGIFFIVEPSFLENLINNSNESLSENRNLTINKLGNPILLKYYFALQ
jgi:hypothetical protein